MYFVQKKSPRIINALWAEEGDVVAGVGRRQTNTYTGRDDDEGGGEGGGAQAGGRLQKKCKRDQHTHTHTQEGHTRDCSLFRRD